MSVLAQYIGLIGESAIHFNSHSTHLHIYTLYHSQTVTYQINLSSSSLLSVLFMQHKRMYLFLVLQ